MNVFLWVGFSWSYQNQRRMKNCEWIRSGQVSVGLVNNIMHAAWSTIMDSILISLLFWQQFKIIIQVPV